MFRNDSYHIIIMKHAFEVNLESFLGTGGISRQSRYTNKKSWPLGPSRPSINTSWVETKADRICLGPMCWPLLHEWLDTGLLMILMWSAFGEMNKSSWKLNISIQFAKFSPPMGLFTIHDVERDDRPKSDVGETVSPLYYQTNLRVSGRPVSLGVAGQILPEGKVDTAMNDALIQNRSFTRNQTLLPSLNSED